MQTGKLDKEITLQQPITTKVNGQPNITYEDVENVWAEIITQKGVQVFESAKINAKDIIRVRVRYRDDVQLTWRIKWENQYYNLIAPIDRSARREGALWFTAQAINAA